MPAAEKQGSESIRWGTPLSRSQAESTAKNHSVRRPLQSTPGFLQHTHQLAHIAGRFVRIEIFPQVPVAVSKSCTVLNARYHCRPFPIEIDTLRQAVETAARRTERGAESLQDLTNCAPLRSLARFACSACGRRADARNRAVIGTPTALVTAYQPQGIHPILSRRSSWSMIPFARRSGALARAGGFRGASTKFAPLIRARAKWSALVAGYFARWLYLTCRRRSSTALP
jgi:hypothetical protein